jgi:hypothetical protein
LVLLSILTCYPTSFILAEATGAIPACQESELQNCAVLARNGRTYPATSYELETRNPSKSVLQSMLQFYPTSIMRTQETDMVPACQDFEPQNRAVLNGKTYPVTMYELETRNPSTSVLLSMLQCYPTSIMRTQATDTVLACQDSEPQTRAVLARDGRPYPVTSYEPGTRNPSRLVLLSILQCYPTSFIRAQATGAVPACEESEPLNCPVLARNGRTYTVTSYGLETRNPSRLVPLSMLQCYQTSFMHTQATGTVRASKWAETGTSEIVAVDRRPAPVT